MMNSTTPRTTLCSITELYESCGEQPVPTDDSFTPYGSNSSYAHPLCPPCLCGDKGSNLGYDTFSFG